MLAESQGEYTPEMADKIDAAELAFDEKVERVALRYRSQLATAGAIGLEEARLAKRRKALEADAEWLRSYLGDALRKRGVLRVDRPLASVRIQDNPPAVQSEVPADKIPRAYVRITPAVRSLDKEAVLAAFRAGKKLPKGISVTRGQSVRIS